MMMNKDIDLFLKRLSKIYDKNKELNISVDTIYDQLVNVKIVNNEFYKNQNKSLKSVQNSIYKRYKKDSSVGLYQDNYWTILDNRCNLDLDIYSDALINSFKVYIWVDYKNISQIVEKIISYIISNRIISQVKIAGSLRNDALILRVVKIEDVKKLENYINNELEYNYDSGINPFIYNIGSLSITVDGILSYNYSICEVIRSYLYVRRQDNNLNNVCFNDFFTFVNGEYRELLGISYDEYNDILNYIKNNNELDERYYKIMIFDIFLNKLNNNIDTINYFSKYKNVGYNIKHKNKLNKFNRLLELMLKKYELCDVYKIFYKYILDENILYFTRENNIRKFVYNNFNSINLDNKINEYSWKCILDIYKTTKDKYNDKQVYYALEDLINNKNISKFTNDNNVRNVLAYTVPINIIIDTAKRRVVDFGKEFSISNLIEVINNDIEMDDTL